MRGRFSPSPLVGEGRGEVADFLLIPLWERVGVRGRFSPSPLVGEGRGEGVDSLLHTS